MGQHADERMTFWTDQRMDILIEMTGEGFSAQEVAKRLGDGCTRNAVIGKRQRMGLTMDAVQSAQRRAAEQDRIELEQAERSERDNKARRIAERSLKSSNSRLCATDGCKLPKQPGHRLGLCASCDRALIRGNIERRAEAAV